MAASPKPTQNELEFELELEPVDWQQLYLLANLTPGQRMLAMAQASAFARGILRGAFRRRFPDLPMAEINMMVLRYVSKAQGRELLDRAREEADNRPPPFGESG